MSLLEEIAEQVRACRRCVLAQGRNNAVPGAGPADARIMFVGEAPGQVEDQQGIPFVGPAGKVLDNLLKRAGLTREEVFITNIVKCRPPENRDPRPDEVEACRELRAPAASGGGPTQREHEGQHHRGFRQAQRNPRALHLTQAAEATRRATANNSSAAGWA